MRTVAVVPMKLTNRRLPQKNTRCFTYGQPLCHYILSTLLAVDGIDEVYAYCSDPAIQAFLPHGITYLPRPTLLDEDTTSMNTVLLHFAATVAADVYVLAHATAPFLTPHTITQGLHAVTGGDYDSSFSVRKVQDFLWKDGVPFNYALDNIPRTQDLAPLYAETSGFYIFRREVLTVHHRRIGVHPFLVEVGAVEAVDIDDEEDFLLADALYTHLFAGNSPAVSSTNKE